MKCTNRFILPVSFLLTCSVIFAGCGSKSYDLPYDPDLKITGFTFDSSNKEASINGFASNLCVAKEDILPSENFLTTAEAYGLFDLNNKNTIIAKNANKRLNPASLTKIMTAIVALDYGSLDDIYTASSNVEIKESGVQLMGLKEGDRLTLSQALNGLLLYSGNDCGVVIAENIAGSIDSFAELMNKKAKSLGATNTNFKNPHGLTNEEHYTTIYDLYLIFNEATKYPDIMQIINKNEYSCIYKNRDGNDKKFECATTNGYINGKYTAPEGITVLGGKTGTTNAAGSCLIILSYDDAQNPYISVILNDNSHESLYSDMSMILSNI